MKWLKGFGYAVALIITIGGVVVGAFAAIDGKIDRHHKQSELIRQSDQATTSESLERIITNQDRFGSEIKELRDGVTWIRATMEERATN